MSDGTIVAAVIPAFFGISIGSGWMISRWLNRPDKSGKRKTELQPEPRYRPEFMRVEDVANHSGTAGYVHIGFADRGALMAVTIGGTVPSSVGRSPEGQVWITRDGTVTATPEEKPWAYVAHFAGEGLAVFMPDEWGRYVTLLADNPPDRWIPAVPGKDPGDVQPRGISAAEDEQ